MKYDSGKLKYNLIPPLALKRIAEVLTFGAEKYEANSWQNLPDFKNRYTAAAMRHFEAWRAGELFDPESGLPHLAHSIVNLIFLLWGDRDKSS